MQKISQDSSAIYRDPAQPIDGRIADLLNRMTLEEKAAQLGSVWVYQLLTNMQFDLAKAAKYLQLGLGQITRVGGASSLAPAEAASVANSIQRYLIEETRLGIPAMMHEECCSGFMTRNATCFPQIIGVASTWEPELVEAMADVVRTQMRAVGAHQGLSPVLDVTRDPRWGRVEETFGEDPYLVSQMGVHFVRGLQGKNWQEGIVSTAKHFVGYGLSEGGMNWAPAHIPPRELREVFLLPFETAVKEANLQSVMNAYHELDGVPCAASKELLTDILRDEWGFDGIVVSDYFAVQEIERAHHLSSGKAESAHLALTAGIDIELPHTDCYGDPLVTAVRQGQIDEALVDLSVTRALRTKFMLGLFENPYAPESSAITVFDTPEQRQLARTIAQKSLVLLKNEGDLLPLDKSIGSIAVIGPQANTVRHLLGDYAYPCHIESLHEMSQSTHNVFGIPIPGSVELVDNFVPIRPILAAIEEKVAAGTAVTYAKGCEVTGDDRSGFAEAVAAAEKSEVALVFVGGKSGLTNDCTCGEARDRAEINLTGVQEELVQAIAATGKPVVVVLVNGRPLSINWIAENVPAVLEAWLPGEEGAEAVADVLFGDVNPGGKLPITFPRDVGQIPIYYNHKVSGGRSHWKDSYVNLSNKPLWPFGFGLSYTTFTINNLQQNKTQVAAGETIQISCTLTNSGSRDGEEVVQLYINDPVASVTRRVKELKGFKRVALAAGESRQITFSLPVSALGFYNRDLRKVVEPGEIQFMIGPSSEEICVNGRFQITGEVTDVSQNCDFFSTATITEPA
ncbi:MAG: glycoside hydrolase family 3 C-terminal domain-containing protein [Ardenticatenaceae bacterium]|nr:glycoside hydrolase family 3 C-terminal domain-containing protein [Ardenticatenaceae bacterium]